MSKNKRLTEIDTLVDNILKNNKKNDIFKKYESELQDFDYIDSLEKFSLLTLRGTMKYVNKYDKKLRSGGLLAKIINQNNKWYALIKQGNKFYKISYKSNYIFYIPEKSDLVRNFADLFITELEKGNYEI
jgi:cyclopropane fatty-acyl-phospholipid synthase-like methyltransferase